MVLISFLHSVFFHYLFSSLIHLLFMTSSLRHALYLLLMIYSFHLLFRISSLNSVSFFYDLCSGHIYYIFSLLRHLFRMISFLQLLSIIVLFICLLFRLHSFIFFFNISSLPCPRCHLLF